MTTQAQKLNTMDKENEHERSTNRDLLTKAILDLKYLRDTVAKIESKTEEMYKYSQSLARLEPMETRIRDLEDRVKEIIVVNQAIRDTKGSVKASVAFWIGLATSMITLLGVLGALFATGSIQ